MTQTITLSLTCNTDQAALILTLHEILASRNTDSFDEIADLLENSHLVANNLPLLVEQLVYWLTDAAELSTKQEEKLNELVAWIHQQTRPSMPAEQEQS